MISREVGLGVGVHVYVPAPLHEALEHSDEALEPLDSHALFLQPNVKESKLKIVLRKIVKGKFIKLVTSRHREKLAVNDISDS